MSDFLPAASAHPNSVPTPPSIFLPSEDKVKFDEFDKLKSKKVDKAKLKELEPRLPVFLVEPKDGFVIKARPAQLNCSVIHSEKVIRIPKTNLLQKLFLYRKLSKI